MTATDLRELLDEASAGLPERDFAGEAWRGAQAVRTRRRYLAVGATAAVAAAAAVVVAVANPFAPQATVPGKSPSQTATTTPPDALVVRAVATDGTPIIIGPDTAGLDQLPFETGLPRTIGWTGTPEDVSRVVGTMHAAGQIPMIIGLAIHRVGKAYEPVLLLQPKDGGDVAYARVPIALVATDPVNSELPQLNASTISADRRLVAIVQPKEVILIDSFGSVSRFAQPADPNTDGESLIGGGYARDGRIVVNSAHYAWTVDPDTGAYTRIGSEGRSDDWILDTVENQSVIKTFSPTGIVLRSSIVELPQGGWMGSTVTGRGWIARGGSVDPNKVPADANALNGLFVVSSTDPSVRRLIVLTDDTRIDRGMQKGGVRALTWWDSERLIFEYDLAGRSRLLGFNARTGELFQVAELGPMFQAGNPEAAGLVLAQLPQ